MKKEQMILQRITKGEVSLQEDVVATEQLLEVFVDDSPVFTVSCTPENLQEFFTGFLFSRGLIESAEEMKSLRTELAKGQVFIERQPASKREVCETQQTGSMRRFWDIEEMLLLAEQIFEHPGPLFEETGCAHCCALASEGKIHCCFEDIGRHNALDKAVGFGLLHGISLGEAAVYTSGRISADYVKKLVRAGIHTVISRAAVTGEAVRLARENHIQMLGFVRKGNANVYSFFSGTEALFPCDKLNKVV